MPQKTVLLALCLLFGSVACSHKVPSSIESANSTDGEIHPVAAVAELARKAQAGDAVAQRDLARRYYRGEDVKKDFSKAVVLYQQAAEQGDAAAERGLGFCYQFGKGVAKDSVTAVAWWRKAAAQGDAASMGRLGIAYYAGDGVEKDSAKALEWLQKADTAEDVTAQAVLGRMYKFGDGVPKDVAKAIDLLRKAATGGNAAAQLMFGTMNYDGDGVAKNLAEAKTWFENAVEQDNAEAQVELGAMYADGAGTTIDHSKAAELFRKAAMQGNATGQVDLADAYAFGKGVVIDSVLAYAWANLAASHGMHGGAQIRDYAEAGMTSAQVAEAQRLSSNWKDGADLVREGSPLSTNQSAGGTTRTLTRERTGTLFVVNKAGQAVTNHHVVEGCRELRREGAEGVAKVIVEDTANDLALVQLSGTVDAAASIAKEPQKLRQGDEVVVFGFPLNSVLSSGGNLTPGVVSALTGLGNNTNQIQITAPIQPGSSGSPVINKRGEVVGVVSMKLSDTAMASATGSVSQNVNFAVSGQTLRTFLDTHRIDYRSTSNWFARNKILADIGDDARAWTLVIECWR